MADILPAQRLAAMAQAWTAAAQDWDPAALAGLYSHDAVLFGGRPGLASGGAAIADYFESYRGVILSASLELSGQTLLNVGETALLAQGFGLFAFVLGGGKPTRQEMRTTLLLDWASGETLIRAHHFSPVPAAPPLGD